MTILVFWSGGVDSTACVKYALEQPSWQVSTHYVRILDGKAWDRRAAAEERAIDAIMPSLRAIRPFDHAVTTIDVSQSPYRIYRPTCFYFVAGMALLMNWGRIDKVMTGRCLEDRNVVNQGVWVPARALLSDMIVRPAEDVILPSPFSTTPKADVIRFLGPLADLTWSCYDPQGEGDQPCGVCHGCRELTEARSHVQ